MDIFLKWLRSRTASTGMEYGMIAAGVSLAIVLAVFMTGESVSSVIETISGYISENL